MNTLADQEEMPPQAIVACVIAESNIDEHAERWGAWPDVSFGEAQQTVLYAASYGLGDGTATASNVAAVRSALFVWQQALDIAAPQLGTYWGEYGSRYLSLEDGIRETLGRYNYPAVGYAGNPNAANIDRAVAASAAYVGAAPAPLGAAPVLVYDASYPPERQTYDWTCSLNASYWLLCSIGAEQGVTKEQYGQEMLAAGLIDTVDGLLDGTGASLAAWLRERFGIPCEALGALTYAELAALAGTGPIAMGSWSMYHWLAVRRLADAETLALMNPAPGWKGVGEQLDDEGYDYWAPWQVLYVPTGEGDMASQAELDACHQHESELINQLGYLQGDVAGAIQAGIDAALAAGDLAACQEAVRTQIQPAASTLARGGA